MGRPGIAAAVLFAVAAALLLLQPLPPLWKGSVWSWLAGYLALAAGVLEVRRHAGPIRRAWAERAPAGRIAIGIGAAGAALAVSLAVRALAPDLFERAGREEGLIEPLTLLSYLSGAVLLLAARPRRDGPRTRHLALLAGAFLLLGLEEVDYFGVFGSLIGRVEGQYVGSLHDVIGLAAAGALPPAAAAALLAVALLAAGLLHRRGYLQPGALAATRAPAAGAALLGIALLVLGSLVEAEVLGPVRRPSPEEAIELAGAICLALFALETAAGEPGEDPPRRGVR